MEYRVLGRTGLKVSVLCFGAMTFGGVGRFAHMGHVQVDEARRLLDQCMDAGVNLVDTANVYSNGVSEEILGEALAGKRDRMLIATKFHSAMGPGPNDMGASRHHIMQSCEASLRRLKTDHIDLYQVHNQDLLTAPEETMRALDDLVRAGKVRYVGSSNLSGWYMMKSLAASDRLGLVRYASQQIQYSLLWRDAEDELVPLGLDQDVGALIWSPLASGYLSGKFRRPGENSATRLSGEALSAVDDERARAIVDALEAIAEARGVTPAQVALNWVVRRAGVASVIVGARNETQLADNLAAATWSLDDAEMQQLSEVSRPPRRYPYYMHSTFAVARNPAPQLQTALARAS